MYFLSKDLFKKDHCLYNRGVFVCLLSLRFRIGVGETKYIICTLTCTSFQLVFGKFSYIQMFFFFQSACNIAEGCIVWLNIVYYTTGYTQGTGSYITVHLH